MISPAILDTSVASFLLNRAKQLSLYRPHLMGVTPILSFQTVAELRHGALKANWGVERTAALELFLAGTETVHSSEALTRLWAKVTLEARRIGRRLEAGDAWIAATALLLNAPLLTHDKDFDAQACPSVRTIRYADPKPVA